MGDDDAAATTQPLRRTVAVVAVTLALIANLCGPATAARTVPSSAPGAGVVADLPALAGVLWPAQVARLATRAANLLAPCRPPQSPQPLLYSGGDAPAGHGVGPKTVALTFDDGPSPDTPYLLDLLRAKGVHATFFVIGENARLHPELIRRIAAEGHVLANHTWDHSQLTRLDAAGQAAEIDATTEEIQRIAGVRVCLLRPPYGLHDETTLELARARRMSVALWSVDTEDWKAPRGQTASWTSRIRSRAEAGGGQHNPMILFHDGGGPEGRSRTNTVAATGAVIDYYRAHGYTFTDVHGRDLR